MANRGFGRPYQSTPNGVVDGLNPGQWVALPGHKKPGRFVGYTPDGNAYVLPPVGRGKHARVSMAAFRLARGRTVDQVASKRIVTGRIVHNVVEASPSTVDNLLNMLF